MENTKMILFYSRLDEPYGVFSNFSHHGFTLGGKYWPTSEHYFQAQKFAGTEHEEEIRLAPGPQKAADKGRERHCPLRSDWETVKEDVMGDALRAKFAAHPKLRETLLETGDALLIENAPGDYYWGCGKDGSGRNRLGHLLMELRTELAAEATEKQTSESPVAV
jgi:N-glycosidase YbiA